MLAAMEAGSTTLGNRLAEVKAVIRRVAAETSESVHVLAEEDVVVPMVLRYADRVDPECMALCDALNSLPGVRAYESDCGDGSYPFRVFFWANQVRHIKPLLKAIGNSRRWHVEAYWSDGGEFVAFRLEGPADPSTGAELAQRIKAEHVTAPA